MGSWAQMYFLALLGLFLTSCTGAWYDYHQYVYANNGELVSLYGLDPFANQRDLDMLEFVVTSSNITYMSTMLGLFRVYNISQSLTIDTK